MYNSQTVKDRINSTIKNRNTSASKVLEMCKFSPNLINQMSDKNGLSSFNLAKIADCLDVSTDYLLGRTDEPNGILIKSGDINGDNNSLTDSNNVNINRNPADDISGKFMEIFNNLSFEQQLAVMNFAVEKSKNKE